MFRKQHDSYDEYDEHYGDDDMPRRRSPYGYAVLGVVLLIGGSGLFCSVKYGGGCVNAYSASDCFD